MDEDKKEKALKLLNDLENNPIVVNQGKVRDFKEFDELRIQVINDLRPVLDRFFLDEVTLGDLRYIVDVTNKRNPLWGFRGVNGQMFFNMLVNSTINEVGLKDTLKEVLKCPKDIDSAKSKINTLINFIKTETSAEDKRALPRIKSTLYFLSYFWQIQKPEEYPIFYSSSEQILTELGFLERNIDLASYYEEFFKISMELLNLFKQKNKKADLWYVEHAFWKYFIEHQKFEEEVTYKVQQQKVRKDEIIITPSDLTKREEMSFIPNILSNLIGLSLNESDPADFEKKTGALFTALGFDVQVEGQGKGRMVDVIARGNTSQPYILLIDCKARSEKDFRFNAGEERTVIEYIKTFSHDYPRDRRLETHYLIVSSGFKDSDELVRRRIKGETAIGVSLITAEALLFLINKKLQTWDMDLDIIREIFQIEGIITEDMIQDIIGR